MGFRFRKTLNILPGIRLNLSKSGTSWTLGGRGASVNLKPGRKPTANVGIPGTGLSWRGPLAGDKKPAADTHQTHDDQLPEARLPGFVKLILWAMFIAVMIALYR